jgi:hypothetical protein
MWSPLTLRAGKCPVFAGFGRFSNRSDLPMLEVDNIGAVER